MLDPASISAALGSAKAILDLLKGANDAQLAIRISGEVANVQGRLIDVQQRPSIYRMKTKICATRSGSFR